MEGGRAGLSNRYQCHALEALKGKSETRIQEQKKKGKNNSERCDWSRSGLQRNGNFQVITDDAVPRISIVYHITHARPKKKERKEPQLLDFGSHKNKVAMKACMAFAVSVDKLSACDVETGPTSAADCTEPHEAAATRKPRRSNLGQRRRTPFCCRFPRSVAFRDKMDSSQNRGQHRTSCPAECADKVDPSEDKGPLRACNLVSLLPTPHMRVPSYLSLSLPVSPSAPPRTSSVTHTPISLGTSGSGSTPDSESLRHIVYSRKPSSSHPPQGFPFLLLDFSPCSAFVKAPLPRQSPVRSPTLALCNRATHLFPSPPQPQQRC